MLLEMSAVMVAIAFVILTFFLIRTLQSVKSSLDEVTQTLGQMKIEVREIGDEVKAVVGNANEMAVDLRTKLTKLDHLFSSVGDVGQVVHELTTTVRQSATGFFSSFKQPKRRQAPEQRTEKWQAVLEGALAAADVLLRIKSARAQPAGKRAGD
ncbi:DUF948 domain-containing protein [Brevibacillus reuszeri]|uniref:DUF948 domain-containing protein n=1 Tax=Brevibacillus reuszeri TaxID=54915 RepID=UPI00366CD158